MAHGRNRDLPSCRVAAEALGKKCKAENEQRYVTARDRLREKRRKNSASLSEADLPTGPDSETGGCNPLHERRCETTEVVAVGFNSAGGK
jgi:hypothetical protein